MKFNQNLLGAMVFIIAILQSGSSFAQCSPDTTLPTVICKDSTLIMTLTATVDLTAAELDAGSFDNCGTVSFSFSPDTLDMAMEFDCNDIGVQALQIWATDDSGNQDFCNTQVEVLDPFDFCGPTPPVCESNCELQCLGQINVSLDQSCEALITPAMGGVGITPACNSYYSLKLSDEHGNPIQGNLVGLEYNGDKLKYEITEPECGNKCWGYALVEYKLPPQIDCPPDMTVTCAALAVLDLPPATGGCADFEVILFKETKQPLVCDPLYTQKVTRVYRARDEFGNEDTCSHMILLERINFDAIVFPEFRTVGNGNAISCNDTLIEFDAAGFPLPWPTNPATGSGTGVPILCDVNIASGIFCPLTGSGNGAPLIPAGLDMGQTTIPTSVACSAAVTYTDIELPPFGCIRKIMRTWEVREWWCNGENTVGDIQLIEIIDDEAPEFICPADFTVSTNYECAGRVLMPGVNAVDECDNGINVAIDYPKGLLQANGGYIDLDLGLNTVKYIVSDDCFNSSTCFVNVTVEDNTNPVSICEQYKVVSLSQSGNTLVFAEPFDNGSWDECGLDRFEVRRMDTLCVAADTLFDESVTFCCADLDTAVMVVFRAWDTAGNYNDCMVTVEVQDKSIPNITCPADVTIDCREPYDINNLDIFFGELVSSDNCSADRAEETVIDSVNQCGIGTLIRLFEIKDGFGNVLRKCKQHITIINEQEFVRENIQFPPDYTIDGACSIEDLLPGNLPEPFGFPVILAGDDECSLIGWDYDDKVFEGNPGSGECAHIQRTWRVINWCGQREGLFDIFEDVQEIIVTNSIAPEMDDQGDLLFESQNVDCEHSNVFIKRSATDDCANPLIWSYILRNESGDIVGTGDSNVLDDTLATGFYTVEWTVTDGCGNFDFDLQNIEVRNTKAPSPVCISGLAANLVLMDLDSNGVFDAEMVELWAEDFDAKSYHSCGNPITFSFSSDPDDKSRIYDCDDIGINVVQMWVTDVITGAQDYCETFVNIQDNNGDNVCEPDTSGRVVIAGDIFTELNAEVEGVELTVGIPDLETMTDDEGHYAFEPMLMGGNYIVTPEKDKEHLNGISTLDIILIQKHILGLDILSSPYKLIAADVDNNQNITTVDLVELRKLILGIYSKLPDNKSWRFVDAEFSFPDNYNPWMSALPEDYEIIDLSQNMDIDFVGVKVGDINGSVKANSRSGQIEERAEETFDLKVEPIFVEAGQEAELIISADDYENIAGWQTTLQYDADKLDIIEIEGIGLGEWNTDNYHKLPSEKGRITMSYSDQSEINEKALLRLKIYAKTDIETSEVIEFGSDIINSQAYTHNYEIRDLRKAEAEPELVASIVSVNPNPWISKTQIEFVIDTDEKVEWKFFDINGRLLYSEERHFSSGHNLYEVNRKQIAVSGVVYVQMITSQGIADYKMLVL